MPLPTRGQVALLLVGRAHRLDERPVYDGDPLLDGRLARSDGVGEPDEVQQAERHVQRYDGQADHGQPVSPQAAPRLPPQGADPLRCLGLVHRSLILGSTKV